MHANFMASIDRLLDTDQHTRFLKADIRHGVAITAHASLNFHTKYGLIYRDLYESHPVFARSNAFKIVLMAYASFDRQYVARTSLNYLSKLFSISRTQAYRVLQEAEDAGFLKIIDRGSRRIEVTQKLIDLVDFYIAIYLAVTTLSTHKAMAEIGFV